MTTRHIAATGLDYLLETVFDQAPNSIIAQALTHDGVTSILDVFSLHTEDIDNLVYPIAQPPDSDGNAQPAAMRPVPRPLRALLHAFQGYVVHQSQLGNSINVGNITNMDPDDFTAYRASPHFLAFNNNTHPTPPPPSRTYRTPAEEFRRGIKRDKNNFPTFKDDKQWIRFNRDLRAEARAQALEDILDPTFVPIGPNAKDLFNEQQKFMYSVFLTTLLTDTGKDLVRQHEPNHDAQKIYHELCDAYTKSTKASNAASKLLSHCSTAQLGVTPWSGTHEAFILHWQESMRQHNELVPLSQTISDGAKQTMLQNAVKHIPTLSAVHTTALQLAMQTNKTLTYSMYCELLISQAQALDDMTKSTDPRSRRRNVYYADLHDDFLPDSDPAPPDDLHFDVDMDLDHYQAYATQLQQRPRIPIDRWSQLDDNSKRIWSQLTDDAKRTILASPAPPGNPPQRPPPPPPRVPPRRSNFHAMSAADLVCQLHDLSMGSDLAEGAETPEPDPPDIEANALLAHVTKQTPMKPGELQRVMSTSMAQGDREKSTTKLHPREVIIDGRKYVANHTNIRYNVTKARSSSPGVLVDRGANGGIAGDDVRIIARTGKTVDVEGLAKHQVTNIPIVTCAGVVHTQRGMAIAYMHQFAHVGKGHSILASAQMEHFGLTVDDKSCKVGGKQSITTPDGAIMPLAVKNGLAYLKMRPPTDKELHDPSIPHIILTSDEPWDPAVMDSPLDDLEAWQNKVPDDPPDEPSRPFDRLGNLKTNLLALLALSVDTTDALQDHVPLPVDGFYEVFPRIDESTTWLQANMHDLFEPTIVQWNDAASITLEAHDAQITPALEVHPTVPLEFDLESNVYVPRPHVLDDSIMRHTGAPPDGNAPFTHEKTRHKKFPHRKQHNSVPTSQQPDDVDPLEHGPAYKNPSPAIKSREMNWERLRRYFAWLPKMVVQQTFKCTTQLARIPMSTHLQRHYRSPFPALNVPRRDESLATDTVYADVPAIDDGSVAAQFFVGVDSLVCDAHGMKTDKQFLRTLQDTVRQRGAPNKLISDSAKAETSQAVKDYLRWLVIGDWQSQPHCQNQNPAERRYQDVKRMANTLLDRTGAPSNCWLLALQYACFVFNHTAVPSLNWLTPLQVLNGSTPDISVLLRFQFYEPVYYKTEEPSFPSDSPEALGYMVGISENVGHAMTYKILTADTHKIICRSELRSAINANDPNKHLTPPDGETPPNVIKSKFDNMENKSSEPNALSDLNDLVGRTFLLKPTEDGQIHRARIVELVDKHRHNANTNSEHVRFRVSVNNDQYEETLAYNDILQHLESTEEDPVVWKFRHITSHQGPLRPTDPAWKGSKFNVMVEWENGEITAEPLSVIAADDPTTCAIYARENNLLETPGWKRFKSIAKNQKKLFRMVNQAKLRSFRTAPKYMYGYEIPKDYNDALRLDKLHNNSKWQDATALEMAQLHEYKTFLDMGFNAKIPDGYKRIRVHLVFACKHDGRHKARLVADGHLTDIPVDSVYSGVVSLRGLKMILFLAELNGLEIWGTDIGNAYLEAHTKEKVAIIAGPEFGALQGHTLVISKALYGLRSSGKMWHQRFAECLCKEGFQPCKAEPDIWLRPLTDRTGYEYVGVYVDDLAFTMTDPQSFVDVLTNKYKFKLKGTGPISFHLGCDFTRDDDGMLCMHPKKYINRMVDSFERMFGRKPATNVSSPLEKGDHPECDTTDLLDPDGVTQYQSLVGQLQWAVSLERMDIATAVMTVSSFRSAPRIGHLERVKRICGYLHKMSDGCIRFRIGTPDYSDAVIPEYDWSSTVYGNPKEQLPDDAPEPLGLPVVLTHYVDANLYHDILTGRSVTGILHLVNQTPIDFFSKKQATVETATYGSEFVAARTCVEQIIDLRNTFRYLGVPVNDRSYMFGDNESVVNSSSKPDAKLHKRHTALSFHRVREAIASKMLTFLFLDGDKNPADLLSKHWGYSQIWPQLKTLMFWTGDTIAAVA